MNAFERGIVMRASVIGRRFDFRVLLEAAPGTAPDVRTALQHACNLELIVAEGTKHETYSFRHALTRDIVYDEFLTHAIRRIHRRVARALERSPRHATLLEQLAYHSWVAGDGRRSLKYNELAGDRAVAVRAFQDARTYYARARSIVPANARAGKRLDRKIAVINADGD
ncbi:MAG: hypothetical protein IAI49_14935 [Candidatus Eremiobacteraeota bacterium]|nr:hypothetical protein [Candidatus Eremiobacteraeota bacterium]